MIISTSTSMSMSMITMLKTGGMREGEESDVIALNFAEIAVRVWLFSTTSRWNSRTN